MAKKPPAPEPPQTRVPVTTGAGLTHITSLHRLEGKGLKIDPRESLDQNELWGTASLTSDEVKSMFIQAISEGLSMVRAVEAIASVGGRVPTLWRVQKWLEEDQAFKKDYITARKIRGEVLREAALETALNASPEAASLAKVQIQHLQWQASKDNPDELGDKKTLEVNQTFTETLSDKQLDNRIATLIRVLGDKGQLPALDAEVIASESIPE